MMEYAANLGATRIQWIVDSMWPLYDADPPWGFDVLAVACEAAHRYGMRFDAVLKPFEGMLGGTSCLLPGNLPLSDDAEVIRLQAGIIHIFRPMVRELLEMNLARLAGDAVDPGGRITTIRLVKNDDLPVLFGAADISLWTSDWNGGFQRYTGPVTFSESSEWRRLFPYNDKPVRMVTLDGLDLPAGTRFILIRRGDGSGAFTNAVEQIAEVENERGEAIPVTPALRKLDGEKIYKHFKWCVDMGMSRFARQPEAKVLAQDKEAFLALCTDMFRFDAGWENAPLGPGNEILIARGKEHHRVGHLHPEYPEVRQAWLGEINHCVERGVDGVHIRIANHNVIYEPGAFGFNAPVVERMQHPGHYAEARKLNGDAFTGFLREAADLLHRANKQLGVQIKSTMIHHDDRAANSQTFPRNFEWQWEAWIREIVDYVELRGVFILRPENIRPVVERVGLEARNAGIPLVYQSMRGPMVHYDGPFPTLAAEMDWVRKHPDVAAYNLYEIANFSRCSDASGFEGSPDMAELVRTHWCPESINPKN